MAFLQQNRVSAECRVTSPLLLLLPKNAQNRIFFSCNSQLPGLHRQTNLSIKTNRKWSCEAQCRFVDQATTSSSAQETAESDTRKVSVVLDVGSAIIPHPDKVDKGGEDAFFVSSFNGGVIGVADGVSGWAEENVDPALFSRELMDHASSAVGDSEVGSCPRMLLAKAHESTTAIGAATAVLAILEKNEGILRIANLGDCGLRLLRNGEIVFSTSTQQHYFDCPYQLSSEPGAQTADDALIYNVEVCPGDIIVMGSDGLFDNVYDKDIKQIAQIFSGDDVDVQKLATELAYLANKNSKDQSYESPYSEEAIFQGYDLPLWRRILGQKLTGGKLDDITVLTACVVDAPDMPDDEQPSPIQDNPLLDESDEGGLFHVTDEAQNEISSLIQENPPSNQMKIE